jgi:hypothetical protein
MCVSFTGKAESGLQVAGPSGKENIQTDDTRIRVYRGALKTIPRGSVAGISSLREVPWGCDLL